MTSTPGSVADVEVLVIGAGPAGLGVAARLGELGVQGVVVLDRELEPGGLPAQCEHPGFGLWAFRRLLSGRQFADRVVRRAVRAGARIRMGTTVLSVSGQREVLAVSKDGHCQYRARALVFACGCRELPRSGLIVAGGRPAGVFSTGVVQRLHTLARELPGNDVVLVGSDDTGLMAARSLSLAGAKVRAVVEPLPYRLGYLANEWFSLRPFGTPLLLGHSPVAIQGDGRVTGVVLTGRAGSIRLACDTLIFSGAFWPEVALVREAGIGLDTRTHGPLVDQHFQTDVPGVFACGNVLHAADAADHALDEGERAAEFIAAYLGNGLYAEAPTQVVEAGAGVASVVPQRLRGERRPRRVRLAVRVDAARRGARLRATVGGRTRGRALSPFAKPHRSVYLDVSPDGPSSAPLVVTSVGWRPGDGAGQ